VLAIALRRDPSSLQRTLSHPLSGLMHQREHQRTDPTVRAEGHEHACADAVRLHADRRSVEPLTEKTTWVQNAQGVLQ
jgi:hypothetical protein